MRIKNEELLLPDFFRVTDKLVDGYIVCDDSSNDKSIEICIQNPKVFHVGKIKVVGWSPGQQGLQWDYAFQKAKELSPDWIVVASPDHRLPLDLRDRLKGVSIKKSIVFGDYYDFVLTKGDKDYEKGQDLEGERKMVCLDYRIIPFVYRPLSKLHFLNGAVDIPVPFTEERLVEALLKQQVKPDSDYYPKRRNKFDKEYG